jgi:hypothetical protein
MKATNKIVGINRKSIFLCLLCCNNLSETGKYFLSALARLQNAFDLSR